MTDNERDAQTIREALDHAVATCDVADDENMAELVAEARAADAALARLVAALSAATAERDAARAELAAAYGDTTSEWYTALDRERERAEALAAQLQQAREALDDFANPQHWAVDRTFEPSKAVWIGTYTKSPVDHARAALAAAAPATTERHRWPGDPLDGLAGDEVADAEMEFLRASIAVWRSIDERDAMPGGYSAQPLTQDTELRRVERKAWERYRDALGSAAPATTLNEPEGEA